MRLGLNLEICFFFLFSQHHLAVWHRQRIVFLTQVELLSEWGQERLWGEDCCQPRLPHREVETHGPAISILIGFWMSVICDTYIALTWNKRIQSGPDASISSANHTQHTAEQKAKLHKRGPESGARSRWHPDFQLFGCSYFNKVTFCAAILTWGYFDLA